MVLNTECFHSNIFFIYAAESNVGLHSANVRDTGFFIVNPVTVTLI